MNINQALEGFIERSRTLGLHEQDYLIAIDFLKYHEFGLAFDQVVVQLYEYDKNIDKVYYKHVIDIAIKLSIPINEYSYLKELVR
ncbi:MafI family immunity protein [Mucilaginibacter terrae]|uniref:MafI family immunity protein n=1 Tax=Mucilaginibacter terrae TaxID=1955052 RepID=A0ABU3GWJ9_9SPHI|nr:MafI family immunity protein [Mucilaginibacter terrae]MDT3403025.1 hypothetical protein [Mucilaginibacter terrae]